MLSINARLVPLAEKFAPDRSATVVNVYEKDR